MSTFQHKSIRRREQVRSYRCSDLYCFTLIPHPDEDIRDNTLRRIGGFGAFDDDAT